MPMSLTVTIDDTGRPSVSGPIENKLLSYGLLEVAREVIHDYHEEKKDQRVQLVQAETLPPTPLRKVF